MSQVEKLQLRQWLALLNTSSIFHAVYKRIIGVSIGFNRLKEVIAIGRSML